MPFHHFFRYASLMVLAATACSASAYTGDEHRLICTELGITPEAMAAFGMNSVEANNVFDRIDDLAIQIDSLRSLQDQRRTATGSLKEAQKSIRIAETQSDAQQLQSQIDQLGVDISTLVIGIESLQDQIRASILTPGLNATTVQWVCEPDGIAAFVPVEFRFVDLTESDYIDLLPALAAEQNAIAAGESLDSDTQLILSRYRNLPAVQAARSNLLYNLDAVRGAFNE